MDPELSPVATMLLQLAEGMAPLFEAAIGMKATLQAAGFADDTAEAVAREFMVGVMKKSV